MAITVGNGVLQSYTVYLLSDEVVAQVLYTLSNGVTRNEGHSVSLSALVARATAKNRTDWNCGDLCREIAAGVTDYDGTICQPSPIVSNADQA